MLVASVHGDLDEGDDHGEDHPYVDHLHVGGHRQGLGKSKKAATKQKKGKKRENSQCCKDEKDGEVDFNNHINVILDKDPRDEADGHQGDGGDEHGEDVADYWPAKADLHHKAL